MPDVGRAALIVADDAATADAVAASLRADLRVSLRSDAPWPKATSDDLPAAARRLEDLWRALVADFVAEHGRLDVLVTVLPREPVASVADLTLAAFHRRQLQMLLHPWLGLKYAAAAMKPTGGALITVGELVPVAGDVARGMAARAISNMMQAMALECAGADPPIRVNWVEVHTLAKQRSQAAEAVRVLASPRSSFMTGTSFVLREVPHGG